MTRGCVCGWDHIDCGRFSLDQNGMKIFRAHAVAHLCWWEGVPLAIAPSMRLTATEFEAGSFETHAADTAGRRRVAHELAALLARENDYDRPMFPFSRTPLDSIRCLVKVDGAHAIAAVFFDDCTSWTDLERNWHGDPATAVEGMFVAAAHRKRGVMSDMMDMLAQHRGVFVQELAFRTPFSNDGVAFLRSVIGENRIRLAG